MFHFPALRHAFALFIAVALTVSSVWAGNENDIGEMNRFGNWNAGGQERIKDLTSVGGVRDNQLIGYGLVVGLDGTGDQTTQAPFSTQSLKNMLGQLGVTMPEGINPQTKNLAAVMVTADLPALLNPGSAWMSRCRHSATPKGYAAARC